ncbi:hypothetical protein CEE37_02965 [candidate division LCP-89 bacterium B3_LCP]|uniref:Glycosyltransferase RgtA/B/C/D-like domain-containing protein n=1 Tax=candidate division LCP-89 bacterium B3_LCP TaxID=2012998 RepID=A0A532V2T7_UNCL8|nr:MAG: hypothetical protein CEE37_02965 [candidate division LCP-89 bacterium B3_LCP]
MKIWSRISLPLLIFITALLLRILHIAFLEEGFYFSDFKAYDRAAQYLVEGQGFDPEFKRPPLYPLFLALQYLLFGHHILLIRIFQAIMGAYSCVLIFYIADKLLGKKPASISAWISVFYPYYVFITGLLYPTMLTTFLLICTIYFLVLAVQDKSIISAGIAAFLLGLASLAVPVCLAFVPFLLIWFIFWSGLGKSRGLIYGLIALVVVVITLVPWTYYGYQHYGRLIVIDPRLEKHLPIIKSPDESNPNAGYNGGGERFNMILDQPGRFMGNAAGEFVRFWKFIPDRIVTSRMDYRQKVHEEDDRMVVDHPYTSHFLDWVSIFSYGPVFLLALVGIALNLAHWQLISLPLLLAISQALGYSMFFAQTRYRLPIEFCLMILAGGGIYIIWKKIRNHKEEYNEG